MSLGFTCPKSEGNYGTWYQWSENKCRDTSVRITLVWVTGDTHPPSGKSINKVCETQDKKKEKVCKVVDVAKIVYILLS